MLIEVLTATSSFREATGGVDFEVIDVVLPEILYILSLAQLSYFLSPSLHSGIAIAIHICKICAVSIDRVCHASYKHILRG